MSFFQQKGGSNNFARPKTPDKEVVDPIYIFHGPINLIGHHIFSIHSADFKKINEKYLEIKKTVR